jgi:hypothetical protein
MVLFYFILDWLSWGIESDAISFREETGSIRWPSMNLEDTLSAQEFGCKESPRR